MPPTCLSLSLSRQVLCLNLEKTIRPVVDWLGTADPASRQHPQPKHQRQRRQQQQQLQRSPSSRGNSSIPEEAGTQLTVLALPPSATTLTAPAYGKEQGWDWGLGLGPEARNKVVCKQGDLLWKSVPTNLASSAAWFAEEVGLSWDDMRKVGVCCTHT